MMKRLFTILAAVLLTATLWAQNPPQKMSYQAVIRDNDNALVKSHAVGMRISILKDGTPVYVETHTTSTNANGLVTIEIGAGTPTEGTFTTIDWSLSSSYSIKSETDPTGGVAYTTIVGISPLLSVPYALYAKNVASYSETDPNFGAWNKSSGISIDASQVSDFQTSVTNNASVLLNTAKNSYPTADQTKLAGIATGANVGVVPNAGITGATKTKITYDTKGLVTAGTDATTADIAASADKNYVTDAQLTIIGNTSGTNSGDNAINSQYSGLVTNATHTGDVTGSEALTLATVNSNVGTFNNITINAKGLATAGSNVSYLTSEADPIVKAINGIVKSDGNTISAAVEGTDYLTPTGSAASLTNFPVLNQNTTGSAASFTGSLAGDVTGTQGATVVTNAAVIGQALTGYVSGAGTVTATDNILQAIQKLNGNNPPHYIGESYGGGIVFFVYDNGQHGLIAAVNDQSSGQRWFAGTITYTRASASGIGAGLTNTAIIIIANQGAGDGGPYAALICYLYSVTVGGVTYADWYLPSRNELNLLYAKKIEVGGFSDSDYWSSSELTDVQVWSKNFLDGSENSIYTKVNPFHVRAIRAF